MKLHILSDLHLEFEPFTPPETKADMVILAGDIHVKGRGLTWAQMTFPDQPVIYVLGNHEYYTKAYPKHLNDLQKQSKNTNIHILEQECLVIGDVTFLGCTLWTDFQLMGDPKLAGYQATQQMNDYRKIRVSPDYRKLRSLDTAIIHRQSLTWLKSAIANCKTNKIVVITHHAPSQRSLPAEYEDDILSAAYASHLDNFIKSNRVQLWIHGHIHTQQNYWIGDTQIICNPRGYPDEPNSKFMADYIQKI